MFSSISDFYPLDAGRILSQVVTTEVSLDIIICPLGNKGGIDSPLVKNLCFVATLLFPKSICFLSVIICYLSCFREGDVFDNHGWKEIDTSVFFCNALFNNFYVTLETQDWKAQLMFFSRVSTFIA